MQRDMSYALDSAFATRNQGQLISTQRVQTTTMRTPGLVAIGDGRGAVKKAPGMLGLPGMGGFSLELPLVGVINWGSLALGAVLGVVVWKLTTSKRTSLKGRLASALANG